MVEPGQQSDASTPRQRISFLTGWMRREKPQSSEKAEDDLLAIHSRENRNEIDPNDINKKYRRLPAEYDHPIWQLGWTDGRSGQSPSVNEKLLEAHARIEWSQKIAADEEQVARTDQEVNLLTQERAGLEQELKEAEKRYKELADERSQHFQDFSRKQAWGYLIFGAAVLIADIPLSLRLVATGFGVKTKAEVNGIELRVDDIFSSNFFQVVQHFWEAIVLALGIAFASILIKYFFDAIVFRDPERKISPLVVKFSWIAVILFILSTLCLGVFRYQIQPQVETFELTESRAKIKEKKIEDKYKELLPSFENEDDATNKARKAAEEIIAKQREEEIPNFKSAWGLPTFIFLTLLFPMISGICFSVAGKKLRNAALYDSLENQKKDLHQKLADKAEALSKKSGELSAFQAGLDMGRTPEAREDLLQRSRYLYRHGYERGAKNVPETMETQEESVYQISYKSIQKQLAERLRNKQ